MKHRPLKFARRRLAVVYVMAMIYLMLFAMLAVGFVAASALSVRSARDDRAITEARAAADSGTALVRAQLAQFELTPEVTGEDLADEIEAAWSDSNRLLPPLRRHPLERQAQQLSTGKSDWILLDDNANAARCGIELTVDGASVWAKIVGAGIDPNIVRVQRLRFDPALEGDLWRLRPVATSYDEGTP